MALYLLSFPLMLWRLLPYHRIEITRNERVICHLHRVVLPEQFAFVYLMDRQTGVLGMFSTTYWVSVLTVTLGASTQFYSYGIVNPEQQLLTQWINSTYER